MVSIAPAPDPGDTLLIDGRPAVVLARLPATPGRKPAVRVTVDLPCGACEAAPLRYDAPRRRWWCPECRQAYDRAALADLAREHVADGVRARQLRHGAPGAAMILHRAAAEGGAAVSRAALFEATTGPERRAMRWALRDDGDRPLTPERCREAARALSTLAPVVAAQ